MVIAVRQLIETAALALGLAITFLTAACGGTTSPGATASSTPPVGATSTSTPAPTATATPETEPSLAPIEYDELQTNIDGDERLVRVYLPDPAPTDKLPLVVFLHAVGETPTTAGRDTRFDQLAAQEGFIVAFPPAHDRAWDAQVTPGLSDSDTDETYLMGLIDQLIEELPVDPKRVYVTGFSMGAVMAGRLACRLADRVTAAAVVSGTQWIGECTPSQPVSILIMHGTGDSTFRYNAAEGMAQDWRTLDDCPAPPTSEAIGDGATAQTSNDCADGTAVGFISVENGWHTWFMSPDATDLVWQFFAEHRRN